jgi:outer membrane biogenesis lipoprotein LolB
LKKRGFMKKVFFLLFLAALFLPACNFDKNHNQMHRQEFDKGISEFHELFDYFFMKPR